MPLKPDDIAAWRVPAKPNPMKPADQPFGKSVAAVRVQTLRGQKWEGVVVEVHDPESGLHVGQKVTPVANKLFPIMVKVAGRVSVGDGAASGALVASDCGASIEADDDGNFSLEVAAGRRTLSVIHDEAADCGSQSINLMPSSGRVLLPDFDLRPLPVPEAVEDELEPVNEE